MRTPTIHTNGTSQDELITQLCDVSSALTEVLSAMGKAAPNGRDYCLQPADGLSIAETEHRNRVAGIQAIKTEYEAMAIAVSDNTGATTC